VNSVEIIGVIERRSRPTLKLKRPSYCIRQVTRTVAEKITNHISLRVIMMYLNMILLIIPKKQIYKSLSSVKLLLAADAVDIR